MTREVVMSEGLAGYWRALRWWASLTRDSRRR